MTMMAKYVRLAVFTISIMTFFCLIAEAVEIGMNTENLPEVVGYLPDIHVRTVRIIVRWQMVEPYEEPTGQGREVLLRENPQAIKIMAKRGIEIVPPVKKLDSNGFYWDRCDEKIAAAKKAGLDVLLTLRTPSLWGTRDKARTGINSVYFTGSSPKDMARWLRFVEALVLRYKDSGVRIFYEVENEVNSKAFWTGTAEEYVMLLKETYRAIKKRDPSAQVLHTAMACGITKTVESIKRRSGLEVHDRFLRLIFESHAFDIISTHNYYYPDREVNGFTFFSYLQYIKGIASEYGLGKHRLWITEFGYVTRPTNVDTRLDPGSLVNQEVWLRDAVIQADKAGVERMLWMHLVDRDREPFFGSMGILETDGTPRPAYKIFKRTNEKAQ